MLTILKERPSIIVEAQKAKFNPKLPLQILLFIGVFIVTQITSSFVLGAGLIVLHFKDIMKEDFDLNQIATGTDGTLLMLFSTIFATILAIVYCRFIERRSYYSMGFVKRGGIKQYFLGMGIGLLMFSSCVLIATLTGALEYKGFVLGDGLVLLILFFIGFLFQGMSEEVILRGYFMISLATKRSILLAIILNSVLFACMHLLNSGVTLLAFVNLFLYGAFASVYVLRTDNLWGICAIHSLWNFVQGNFYGILVSGIKVDASVFSFASVPGKELLNGGEFGMEGGIIVTLVLVISILLTVVLKKREIIDVVE